MPLKRNVLIFHAGALGDFVLSWPLAMAAGRLFAQSRVFYVAAREKGELAEKALRLESADAEAGWHGLFAEAGELPPAAERLLSGAHTVVNFIAEPESVWERNVRRIMAAPGGPADVLTLKPHLPADFAGHHTDFLLHQLADQVVWKHGIGQMLASIAQRGLGLAASPAGPLLLHPGSGSPAKCWPVASFIDLAQGLKQLGVPVCFLLGEVERERFSTAQLQTLRQAGDVAEPRTLAELYALLGRARGFVGNDSGPGHLAGIMGLPVVSLFGPTNPSQWRPLGPNVAVVRREPLTDLSVEEVLTLVKSAVVL